MGGGGVCAAHGESPHLLQRATTLAQALTSGLQTHLTKGICTYLHTHKTANLAGSLPQLQLLHLADPSLWNCDEPLVGLEHFDDALPR